MVNIKFYTRNSFRHPIFQNWLNFQLLGTTIPCMFSSNNGLNNALAQLLLWPRIFYSISDGIVSLANLSTV